MRKIGFLFVVLGFFFTHTHAQTKQDIFNPSVPLTWLGVDFSEMKFIGPASGWGTESTKSASEMRDTYFQVWNDFIVNQPKAFKVEEAVGRQHIDHATDVVRSMNEKANNKEIFSDNSADYQRADRDIMSFVNRQVKQYNFKSMTGIGFLLIAEGMNKNLEEASYLLVFVDMKSKNILLAKRVTGVPSGFGFRNYWLGSIKNVFKKMKKEFKHWD